MYPKHTLHTVIIIIIIIIITNWKLVIIQYSSPYTSTDSCHSVKQSLHQHRQLSLSTAALTPVQISFGCPQATSTNNQVTA
jgi:hypothetical protein